MSPFGSGRILGEEGFVSILVAVDLSAGQGGLRPRVDRAVASPMTRWGWSRSGFELIGIVEQALVDGVPGRRTRWSTSSAGRWDGGWTRTYRRRPMLMPMVIEV